ncbi:MAG: MmgE/PrpD family protein [Chloroflexi bacterium]|nr:MmgE/PrpD family protein [Chloroflexota bacterium]
MTIAEEMADYALGLTFNDLSKEVVEQIHKLLLDTIAITIGGFTADASRAARRYVAEVGGQPESTIVGNGVKTSCSNATLVNGIAARYLDQENAYSSIRPGWYGFMQAVKPFSIIPGMLALGERQGSSGRDIVAATFVAYELAGRLADAVIEDPPKGRGWHHSTPISVVAPIALGKLLGLDRDQLANAIGISACRSVIMNILDTHNEPNNMCKNIAENSAVLSGLSAVFLAREGFTGPTRIIEGEHGYIQTFMAGKCDMDELRKGGAKPKIFRILTKNHPADAHAQAAIAATLQLAREHGITAQAVERIKLSSYRWAIEHMGNPSKIIPQNKESADHSLPYIVCRTIMDGEFTAKQYREEKIRDPQVVELIKKVSLEVDPDLDRRFPEALPMRVEITVKGGASYATQIDYPLGHPRNPMTHQDIENKFHQLAGDFMSRSQMDEIASTVYHLEEVDDIRTLMPLLVF